MENMTNNTIIEKGLEMFKQSAEQNTTKKDGETMNKWDQLHEWLNEEGFQAGENGYDSDEYIIIVDTHEEMNKAANFLESIDPNNENNVQLVFSDEYGECYKCNNI